MLASRLPLATAPGTLLALATFWLLWTTINMPLDVGAYEEAPKIRPWQRAIDDSKPMPKPVIEPRRQKPEREITGAPGPVPPVDRSDPRPTRDSTWQRGTGIATVSPPPPDPTGAGMDTDAIPYVRIEPTYPRAALARGIEGWVRVQFSVTASGAVTDVQIIEADPPRLFDKAALDAVRQWRYRPKIVDGRPEERVGLQTLIRFELPDR
jgi:protein TonB